MEIKIWSDIRCPFCYIGKRKFEAALENFIHKDEVSVSWKSFELDPNLVTQVDIKALDHFCVSKGIDEENARHMFDHAIGMGKEVGLDLDFENSVVANSLKGHRLLKFAEDKGRASDMKEALLKAHLVLGKNIDDVEVLSNLAQEVGLEREEVQLLFLSDDYSYEVKQDGLEARNMGITGVPFFVMDNKYGISGAQPSAVFLDTLYKVWEKYVEENDQANLGFGNSCNSDGQCQ